MNVRQLTQEELPRADELFALAFEIPMDRQSPAEPGDALHWGAFDEGGAMMSTFTVTPFLQRLDHGIFKMGGIGGVATLPQYRRRGGIRACFRDMLPELFRQGYGLSYLYPFSTVFYRQFGYECCVQKMAVSADLGLWSPRAVNGTYALAEPGNTLAKDIMTVDAVWEAKYNMAVQHTLKDYTWTAKEDPAAKQEYCWVYYAENGHPDAYMVYSMQVQEDGRNLVCKRFVFADQEGFHGLMNLLKTTASDHKYVKFHLPNSTALQYLMKEWSLGAVSWALENAGMVRVVNVCEILEAAAYRGSGKITLQIQDDWIPENCGCFTIRFQDGSCLSIEKDSTTPDSVMDIRAFSALITGVCDFSEAAECFDGISVGNPNAPFHQIFYRKPLMISDYF